MYTLSLREFVDPVPVCAEVASPVTVLELLRQTGDDRVVMLDDEQHPIGIVQLHRLMLFLFEGNLLGGSFRHGAIATEQSWSVLATETGQTLLEPLPTLPEYWTLTQFQPYLREIEQHHWAVIDASGRFLGLLNRLRLLQFIATNPVADTLAPLSHPFRRDTLSHSEPLSLRMELPPATVTNLKPLVDLLERLPLPMMLQTSAGRLVTQNLAWRQQVGEWQDPAKIQQEAAHLLESIAPQDLQAVDSGSGEVGLAAAPAMLQKMTLHRDVIAAPSSTCRSGLDLNSCVCTCPMKNGQERVWHLVKIPMGYFSPSFVPVRSPHAHLGLPEEPVSLNRFQLAALDLSAEPAPPALSQTEFLWLVVAQDTTEQQQVAKELAAKNADLVQLNRLKDEFLACISHELKTPLTAILGLSSLLKDQALGALNDRQKRYADLIHQSGRHLVLIVNDILDLTRIETGQLELTLEPIQVDLVCQRAYEQARQLQPTGAGGARLSESAWADMDFSLDIQPGVETLIADEMRLRQMLVNLLSNALKFTPPEGKIGLKVDVWEGWLAFTVWDTGIGIPADKQHLIFQKFQQLENPMTRQFEGTGLGLVLTQRLARLHGGDVTFTSVEGEGSQFTLLLPPCPPPAMSGLGATTGYSTRLTSATSGNRLAIIVEAVPRFWQDLTQQLTSLGYRVAIARSGTEAIEKIRRLQPGVVFLNPLLPMLSGWDVLTLLKTDEETSHIPIVVTATQTEKAQALHNGANSFLSLPIQLDALQHSLERLETQPTPIPAAETALDLTVLHLHGADPNLDSDQPVSLIPDLNTLLAPYQCRVLEVDDLDQADLLARVWKPDLVLLDGIVPEPEVYLKQFNQYPFLVSIPLVTLTPETTQAANRVAGLSVFPCLAKLPLSEMGTTHPIDTSALLQVMQVAAGMNWAPHVLMLEASTIQATWALPSTTDPAETEVVHAKTMEWLQACAQYIQAAGLRGSVNLNWSEVLQQLQHQSIDLLVICVGQSSLHPSALRALEPLEQLSHLPPILLWYYQPQAETQTASDCQELHGRLAAIATRILPASISIKVLLEEISQILNE
jgi:signal transduction histidine kinase/ActR/RegA family two-component response regulator